MRNNINGDFSIVEKISELKAGAFININWNKKKLMLPYSLRKDYISFTDKKWDWRYQFNKDGSPDINNPSLYELLPSGEIKTHFCETEDKFLIYNFKINILDFLTSALLCKDEQSKKPK